MHRLALLILIPLSCLPGADADLAGRYAGAWKSNGSGGGGALHIKLEPSSEGWKCEVNFNFAGADVKTTMRTCKVDQSKLDAAYDFELEGNAVQSKITGQWNGKTFEGSYESVAGSQSVDDGTWTAKPAGQ